MIINKIMKYSAIVILFYSLFPSNKYAMHISVSRLLVCIIRVKGFVHENGEDESSLTPLSDAELFKLVTSVITVISAAWRTAFYDVVRRREQSRCHIITRV